MDYKVNGVLVNEKSDGEKELLIYVKTLDNGIQLPPTGPGDALPYLRPMSSMTEEEEDEYDSMFSNARRIYCNCEYYDTVQEDDIPDFIDWLNAHHFDYRGLIEKGLALEAPVGMYKIE